MRKNRIRKVNNYPGFLDEGNLALGLKFFSTATRKEKRI